MLSNSRVGPILAHERFGEGPPLVLIHGLGHRRQAWYPVVDRLAPHREVILVDLPGHGQSPAYQANGRAPREHLRDLLLDFLNRLGLDRPHLVGNSLGGLIALESAVEGHAGSVTVLSPAGFWRDARELAAIQRFFRTAVQLSARTAWVGPSLVRTPVGRTAMYAAVVARPRRVAAAVAGADLRAFVHAGPTILELLPHAYSFEAEVPVDVPVTIAWGTHDRILRKHQAERARLVVPHATHVRLPRCGHVPMSDRPGLVAKVILSGSAEQLDA